MKTQKRLKRITALLMCAVLLATSLPIALAAGAGYNPVPVFDANAREVGASAWFTDKGDIAVRFPQATANGDTWNGEAKTIAKYIIELYDLGPATEVHTENIILTQAYESAALVGTASAADASITEYQVTLSAADFKYPIDTTHRYGVNVYAQDTENWTSETIASSVTDVPSFMPDIDSFDVFTTHATAMREIITFETDTNNTKEADYLKTGDASLQALGREEFSGVANANGVDSAAFAFRLNAPSTGAATFDTTLSRQTWDFTGAEEVWFWMDLSEVELQGLSFRLRANEKQIRGNDRIEISTLNQKYGDTVYSTLGTQHNTYAPGEEPYVWVQQTDGSWEKVLLNNGTIDLGHFKGYVRVPLQYICAETDSVINASNQEYDALSRKLYDKWSNSNTQKNANKYVDEVLRLQPTSTVDGKVVGKSVTVNTAGTPVAQSLLIQHRSFGQYGNVTAYYTYDDIGAMLAVAIEENDAKTANHPRRAYVQNDGSGNYTVMNRGDGTDKNGGYKAIEDIFSAGFAYENTGADSAEHCFYLDNILFYRTDGGEYPSNTLDGNPNTGDLVSKYYDQEKVTQSRILDLIDQYILAPSQYDFKQVQYIEETIAGYKTYFETLSPGYNTSFLTDDSIKTYAESVGRGDTWQNFIDAREACKTGDTYNKNNAETTALVPSLVKLLEKMPDPATLTSIDASYLPDVIRLYRAYSTLNQPQLLTIGKAEEEKLIELFRLAGSNLGEDVIPVGDSLADRPFIPFNTFEEGNYEVGDKVWRGQDDPNWGSDNSYRLTKGIVTYTGSDATQLTYNDAINSRWPTLTSKTDSSQGVITENGYNGSKGLTLNIDTPATCGMSEDAFNGKYLNGTTHVITVTRDSYDPSGLADMSSAEHSMSSASLQNFADGNKGLDGTDADNGLLALMFYADFSELADIPSSEPFYFSAGIYTIDGEGNHIKAHLFSGSSKSITHDAYWNTFYLLDETTGEWERVFGEDAYMFPSVSRNDSSFNLAGYKGYIAIPLRHFKWSGNANFLDGGYTSGLGAKDTEAMRNIYAVEISFGGHEKMNGKGITIDNIGFTYDPARFSNVSAVTARNDEAYADRFDAVSKSGHDFITAVGNIDKYGELQAQVDAAQALYDALPQSQKNRALVSNAKTMLGDLRAQIGSPDLQPIEEGKDAAALLTFISTVPAAARNASVLAANDLPYPGILDGAVQYGTFDLTKESAEQIIRVYEQGYGRFSNAEKADFKTNHATEAQELLNAYYAAKRCAVTLQGNLDQANQFAARLESENNEVTVSLPSGYTPEAVANQSVKAISNRAGFSDLFRLQRIAPDKMGYVDVDYYTKYAIARGNVGADAQGIGTSLYMWLQNTKTITTDNAGDLPTGVATVLTAWTELYNNVKTKMDNRQLLTDTEISNLEAAVDYYNNLDDNYRNTKELVDIINAILKLFPVDEVALDKTELTLNGKQTSDTANYQVMYSEQLPVPKTNAECNYVTVTSQNRGLKIADLVYGYNVTLSTPDGTTVTKKASELAPPLKITDVIENNQFTADSPWNLAITPAIDSNVNYPVGMLTDTLIIEYYTADGAKLEDLTKEVVINYQADDAYTVTIPAEFPITWGTEETDVSYSVDCALKEGSVVSVKVSGSNKLTAKQDSAYTMDYTSQNFGSTEFKGVLNGKKPDLLPAVVIGQDMWKTKPTAVYEDTLTYTVEYTSAP